MNQQQKAIKAALEVASNYMQDMAAKSIPFSPQLRKDLGTLSAGLIAIESIEPDTKRGGIPSGWKLVPIEPTSDMIVKGFESAPDIHFDGENYPTEYDEMSGCQQAAFRAKRCYAAMLAAAPTTESGK